MAMLYLLHRFDVETVVVHCNYQVRGEASDKDQELVEEMCMLWKMECVSLRFDSQEEANGNFQDWARRRRYQAFRDIKKEYNADLILTAHHQDDQVETILQKIMRGAGVSSWKGMDIIDGDLFRPFLRISQSEIMDFVQNFNIPYRIDRSNEESTYARNFIRNQWFPDLNRLFPGWEENLLKLQDRAEEFKVMSDTILSQISEGKGMLNRKKFLNLDASIQPAIFLHFIKKSGVQTDVSRGFLEDTGRLEKLQTGGSLQLSEHIQILRDRDLFVISEEHPPDKLNIQIEKEGLIESLDIAHVRFSLETKPGAFSDDILHLDLQPLEFPLTLRTWKDGDSFQPLGLNGTQLVSDHLTNRKIPSVVREKALVLESFDGEICALIFPAYSNTKEIGTLSEKVRCRSKTKKTLTIRKTE